MTYIRSQLLLFFILLFFFSFYLFYHFMIFFRLQVCYVILAHTWGPKKIATIVCIVSTVQVL